MDKDDRKRSSFDIDDYTSGHNGAMPWSTPTYKTGSFVVCTWLRRVENVLRLVRQSAAEALCSQPGQMIRGQLDLGLLCGRADALGL